MKSHPVPKVGDTVALNDHGLKTLFGSHWATARHMKTLRMKITWVDKQSMTAPEQTFIVRVDNADINHYMISHWDFDIVR